MIVVSFVVQKILARHPTSGRDSTQFNLDDLLNQVGSGKINPGMLQNSGMVDELARTTGLDHAAASKNLDAVFTLVSKRALNAAAPSQPNPGKTLKSAGSSNTRITR